jgi:hypothetical protein
MIPPFSSTLIISGFLKSFSWDFRETIPLMMIKVSDFELKII